MRPKIPDLARDFNGLDVAIKRNQIRLTSLKYGIIEDWHTVGRDGMTQLGPPWIQGNFNTTVDPTDSFPDSLVPLTQYAAAAPLSYFRNPDGFVHLRGLISVGGGDPATFTDDLFALPGPTPTRRGWRPERDENIHVLLRTWDTSGNMAMNHVLCRIDATTGLVTLRSADADYIFNDWQFRSATLVAGSQIINCAGAGFSSADLDKFTSTSLSAGPGGEIWKAKIIQVNSASQIKVEYAPTAGGVDSDFGWGTAWPPVHGTTPFDPVWSFGADGPGGIDLVVFDGVSFEAAL
jgi:hypothetical protein